MIETVNKIQTPNRKLSTRLFSTIRDNVLSAVSSLTRNLFRSFLTLSGIVIGVIAVVTLVAILQGVKAEISRQVEGLGANLVIIVPSKLDENGQPNMMSVMGVSTLTEKDIEQLRRSPGVRKISPIMFAFGSAENPEHSTKSSAEVSAMVVATNTQGIEMNPTPLLAGRYFREDEKNKNLCVLGFKPSHDLFGNESALGRQIRISGSLWTVVGILSSAQNEGSVGSQVMPLNSLIYIPVEAAKKSIPGVQINRIVLQTDYQHPADKMVDAMQKTLLDSHKNREDFGVITSKKGLEIVIKFISLAQDLLVLIAAISLFVAGIGIMNIMLVTVTERTREIGIRKTVGARRIDIFIQFLTEAMVLSLLGGILGIALSEGICAVISHRTSLHPIINLTAIGMALAVCMAVGVVFGVLPAIRAASLSPIEALRYE